MPPPSSASLRDARDNEVKQAKYKVTSCITTATPILGLATAEAPTGLSQTFIDTLKSHAAKLQSAYERLTGAVDDLCEIDPENVDTHHKGLDKYSKEYASAHSALLELINKGESKLRVPPSLFDTGSGDSASPGGSDPAFNTKLASALKPSDKLSQEFTTVELRTWIDNWMAYFEAARMSQLPLAVQQAHLLERCTPVIAARLRIMFTNATTMSHAMDAIKEIFRDIIPTFSAATPSSVPNRRPAKGGPIG